LKVFIINMLVAIFRALPKTWQPLSPKK
jgi:hypothetical protein